MGLRHLPPDMQAGINTAQQRLKTAYRMINAAMSSNHEFTLQTGIAMVTEAIVEANLGIVALRSELENAKRRLI